MSVEFSDSDNEFAEEHLKVVLLGEPSVGKTNIAARYCRNEFTKQYFPTCGIDFFQKRLTLQKTRNITLKIWDVGGSSYNGNMLDKYIYGVNIILFIYDVTNDASFNCIPNWMELVREIIKLQDIQPLFMLIGNKCDLEHKRSVKIETHQKYTNDNNLISHVISSRTGECVNLAFQKAVAEYLGIKMTKSEIEEFQPVIRAEISIHSNLPLHPAKTPITHSRSSVCSLQ